MHIECAFEVDKYMVCIYIAYITAVSSMFSVLYSQHVCRDTHRKTQTVHMDAGLSRTGRSFDVILSVFSLRVLLIPRPAEKHSSVDAVPLRNV